MNEIKERIKQKFGSVSDFCDEFGYEYTNFNKYIKRLIGRMGLLNKLLDPLDLEVRIIERIDK